MITPSDFLPKDRDAALQRIKEELYARLNGRQTKRDEMTSWHYERDEIDNEIEFLRSLIDMIERS